MFAQDLDDLIRHLGASPEQGSDEEKFRQYRGLVNQRLPYPVSQDYLDLESRFLAAWRQQEPIYHLADCQKTAHPSLYLWQGEYHPFGGRCYCECSEFSHARLL